MNPRPALILKPGKEKPLRNRHHWIFSGAVQSIPSDAEDGSILPIESSSGELLGHAYINRKCSILGRMLNFDGRPPLEALAETIDRALSLRLDLFDARTNAVRLVNGEGDGAPGLIVDRYADVLVLQISTLGMEKLRPFILDRLVERAAPRAIYERSNAAARREEGLAPAEGLLHGPAVESVEILEDGLRFEVDIVRSQKTGLYLDQREMRRLVRILARNRRVLNAFSYTGGFTVHALAGGASAAVSVDSSAAAVALAARNAGLNGFPAPPADFIVADVFDFIREQRLDFDLVILDPPAFAKKKAEVVSACRGYKDLNRVVLQKVPAGALVLTFSCSFFVDEALFRQVLFQAAREAARRVRILERHRQAHDHPVNIYHPESEYLKGFLLHVD
jgi:23S rRNA (cytosine1962-C5)-methyltransferase